MDLVQQVEAEQKRNEEDFRIGDTVKVYFQIVEGRTQRVQVYEGLVISKQNAGVRRSFTVRKISYGVGVERVFPLNSPRVQQVEVVRRGRVRRAKLYYIRDRVGKAAKVPELIRKKRVEKTAAVPAGEVTTGAQP